MVHTSLAKLITMLCVEPFTKWGIDFIGPIKLASCYTNNHYVLVATDYDFEFSIHSTCLSLFCFVYVHINCSRSRILIPFSRSVVVSMIARLLFATTSDSHLSIFIGLCCPFAITYTSMDYYTATYTFVDGCIFAPTMFSSLTSVCAIYASTKCYSTTLSSSNFSMNIGSTNVIPSLVYFLARQPLLLMHKNSTANVLVVFMS